MESTSPPPPLLVFLLRHRSSTTLFSTAWRSPPLLSPLRSRSRRVRRWGFHYVTGGGGWRGCGRAESLMTGLASLRTVASSRPLCANPALLPQILLPRSSPTTTPRESEKRQTHIAGVIVCIIMSSQATWPAKA
ncbi:unnamed protein product [Miscanthus lutarioriparius]|uniref:Uncharacterized protein n=1 Tax=Miscanthus lutarioriparius TaxID=422564 RepID=A0A811RD48_9POAL|nr:unnamed protein product [Miscanthus lutarioriparius]